LINDVSGGNYDPAMIPLVREVGIPYIAMHMRGEPSTMLGDKYTTYENPVQEVIDELQVVCDRMDVERVPRWLQIIDPGVGFSKLADTNRELLKPENLYRIKHALGNRPLLIGLSRKRFLTSLVNKSSAVRNQLISTDEVVDENTKQSDEAVSLVERDLATAAACCSIIDGGADILRVHDVAIVKTVCDIYALLKKN
jgi:2-amino-4-hydroxy-6-hydroxymethyldihydropteridine diphosphokinase/dihydropteroate synthase